MCVVEIYVQVYREIFHQPQEISLNPSSASTTTQSYELLKELLMEPFISTLEITYFNFKLKNC